MMTCDVLVIGAGVAGVPAAVAAARAGASVLLAEKRGAPGGAAVTAMHRFICGLYTGDGRPDTGPLNGGLTAEICDRLSTLAPDNVPMRIGRTRVLPYSARHLAAAYAEMIAGENNIDVHYNVEVVDARVEACSIADVTLRRGTETVTVRPRTAIDCTGTGELLALAGAGFEVTPLNRRQLAGFTVLLSGPDNVDEALSVKVAYVLRAAAEAGRLPRHLVFSSVTAGTDGALLKISRPPGGDGDRRTRAMEDVDLVCRTLAESLAEFAGARIADAAEDVMDRDGRTLNGRYTLSEGDVLEARKFDDPAARGAWPLEFWDQQTGPSYRYVPDGDWYEIPLRCLRSDTIPGLFSAGRCISAAPGALASTRVMGICMALGAAAGNHAAESTGAEMQK